MKFKGEGGSRVKLKGVKKKKGARKGEEEGEGGEVRVKDEDKST